MLNPHRPKTRTRHRQIALVAAQSLVVLACGCGGGNTGVEIPSLEGTRAPQTPLEIKPSIDLTDAPTDAHRKLGRLLVAEAMVKDSVMYARWDAATAVPLEYEAGAPMPCVRADYLSSGYRVIVDDPKVADATKRLELEYPQRCTLILIQAPEAQAADAIAERLRQHCTGKGFESREPLSIGAGTGVRPQIERLVRIDSTAEIDTVYVAYIQVIGDIVAYAVEAENPPRPTTKDGTQIARVLDDQRGTRVGAQLITLVYFKLNP